METFYLILARFISALLIGRTASADFHHDEESMPVRA